jgi:hypothetical protein
MIDETQEYKRELRLLEIKEELAKLYDVIENLEKVLEGEREKYRKKIFSLNRERETLKGKE